MRQTAQVHVEVLDSRREFRPGRSGGSVNWGQLVAGVLLIVFGVVCVAFPLSVLKGFSFLVALLIIAAGLIDLVLYLRARNTLFSQDARSLSGAVILIVLGIALAVFPMVGVAIVAWILGLGFIVFGAMQLFSARGLMLMGSGLGIFMAIAGAVELVLGVLVIIWPSNLGKFLGVFAIVQGISTIVFALPIGRDSTNGAW